MCWETADRTGSTGIELWATDGSEEGTRRVRDINPGPPSSSPSDLYEFEGRMFFQATTASSGTELWTTQGTLESTFLLVDLVPGTRSSYPRFLTGMHSKLFFSATTLATGREPWSTMSIINSRMGQGDHNEMGAGILYDICAGPGSSNPQNFVVLKQNQLLFQADDCVHGPELWISDGTAMGTHLLADIFPGSEGSHPSYLTTFGEKNIYFQANDGVHGSELWVTDGTPEGTRLLHDIVSGYTGSYPSLLVPYKSSEGSLLIFTTRGADQTQQLWQTDGSQSGTSRVWQDSQQLLPLHISMPDFDSTQVITLNHESELYLFGRETQESSVVLGEVQNTRSYRPSIFDESRSLTLWDVDSCQNSSMEYRLRLNCSEGELILSKNLECILPRIVKGVSTSTAVVGSHIELQGLLDSLNCATARIRYRTASNTEAVALISATLVKLDGQREGPLAEDHMYAHVLESNSPPQVSAKDSYEVRLGEWNSLNEIRIRDKDSGARSIYVKASIRYGRLWFHPQYLHNRRTSQITILNIVEWDQSKQSIELSGSIDNVNEFLATMRYGCIVREGCATILEDMLEVVVNDNRLGGRQTALKNISLIQIK